MPAHPAGQGQNGEQGQCLALSGSLGGVSDLSSHGVGRNPRDSFIYLNIMFNPCHILSTRDTEMNKIGRVLSPRFSWGGAQFAIHRQACDGMSATGQCCEEPSGRKSAERAPLTHEPQDSAC